MIFSTRLGLLALFLFATSVTSATDSLEQIRTQQHQLRTLPLQDLMQLTVTSVSKQAQALSNSATAVFVITAQDIRRSGALSIPEALRMAPGLQVHRIDASQWSITARGFTGRYSHKLLVLVDGRSVYTPTFGGVDWDEQELLLEDIERIEIIRGSGASLWGSNAVNGIINILTKPALETQGAQLIAGIGNEARGFGSARFGGSLGAHAHYRAYIKAIEYDNSRQVQGQPLVTDNWRSRSGGFKLDWHATDSDFWTLDGRLYSNKIGQTLPTLNLETVSFQPNYRTSSADGGHVLSRWQHNWSPTSDHQLQLYYNRSRRDDLFAKQQTNTLDVDFQHYFNLTPSQTMTWGVGYRRIDTKVSVGLKGSANPTHRRRNLFSGFLQGEWRLLNEQLVLTLGTKVEHTTFTAWEIQPNAKALWHLSPEHIVWGSVSHAVHTPTILSRDGTGIIAVTQPFAESLPVVSTLVPNNQYDSEQLLSYELGYRFLPTHSSFLLDFAAYYNRYRKLHSYEASALRLQSAPSPYFELQQYYGNRSRGESYGIEFSGRWFPYESVQFQLAYTWTHLNLRLTESVDPLLTTASLIDEVQTPQQQISLRASFDLPYRTELDLWLRYNDRIKQDITHSKVKEYVSLDARVSWKASTALEFSLVGQNLLDRTWREYPLEFFAANYLSELERRVHFKLDWRF